MISRLGKLFRRRTAVQTGRQNPVFLSTVDMSSKIYDGIPLRNFIGDETRDALARELFLEINEICNALDPVAEAPFPVRSTRSFTSSRDGSREP